MQNSSNDRIRSASAERMHNLHDEDIVQLRAKLADAESSESAARRKTAVELREAVVARREAAIALREAILERREAALETREAELPAQADDFERAGDGGSNNDRSSRSHLRTSGSRTLSGSRDSVRSDPPSSPSLLQDEESGLEPLSRYRDMSPSLGSPVAAESPDSQPGNPIPYRVDESQHDHRNSTNTNAAMDIQIERLKGLIVRAEQDILVNTNQVALFASRVETCQTHINDGYYVSRSTASKATYERMRNEAQEAVDKLTAMLAKQRLRLGRWDPTLA